ncbi:hypothetical protein A3742_07840 [Oleiphilus sp. HI0071]|uniref:TetR/AcrR family transcriptional regulator n=1 Tax=Oleiphilus sp. HI0080 TaxID=1822255 RepID=UPI0007C3BDD7|nr:TetR/AcrR family transcriptional regulator [Oleiphilus sp. HI0080]KZY67175.1 hypothetical protein A3737_12850 [Oleiphilus sp. HI0065]KZY83116.1 hypothetical protein A3742_07840 [Oleiphilus sp. HI0071]KZY91950.1 hypothetical protein A3744_03685 [Oleiphilus sp. HI0073]KZZ61552.1 hypothetical protein A3760_15820 [Oleiphilus sp. HI0122]KZZ77030.1 hypothetical protein A3765_09475 [Oleiphilus sp. HI0130]KZZ80594.1 hypothetical protein A3767_10240 [Oleiphilus sp. HI0133]
MAANNTKTSRRTPTQKRSKERYELVVNTAKQLIGERGNDSVSMREIAKQANVPISSIYQYFPDKNAILEAIMQSYFEEIRQGLRHFVDCCQCREDLKKGIIQGIDLFYATFKQEPTLAILWAGLQANPKLKELDAQDSRENAGLLTDKLCCFSKNSSSNEIYNAVLLLLHSAGMTVRLALDMEPAQADRFIDEYKALALLRLDALP